MKRILLLFSALMLSCIALWAHDVEIDGIYYKLHGKTAEVTYRGYDYNQFDDEYSGSVTIPETITYNSETYSVTSIGYRAFDGCSGLTSVTIPNSVTSIGTYAFRYCSGLTSVTIPNSVTSIGQYAFDYCSGLTKVNYLGTVDKWVEIDFESYLSYYAKDLYINNELLTDVKITTADSIKNHAFYCCQSIKSVEIGESVTSIGRSAFSGCSGLTSVIWNAKNCEDFEYDSHYREYTSPFYNIRSNIASFTIGNNVEHIPAYLCYGMSKLTEITIPNSVTSIGSRAFSGCSGLTSVIWNAKNYKDFSSYSSSPFYEICSNITSFTFGNEVEHIPAYLCNGMSKLTEITIPNSVTSIGSSPFSGCSGLTKVNYLGTVDKWVKIDFKDCPTYYAKDLYINNELLTDVKITTADSIKDYAFENCKSIKSVKIGNSVTSIGKSAFYNCSGLTSVTIPNSVTSIGKSAFNSCSGLTSVTIPNSVTSIGESAFYNCSGLTEVTIPNSVTSIGKSAFSSCSGLTSVTIPNSVTSIGEDAFYSCSELTSVTIGNSITSIGASAFSSCSGLTSVIWNAKNYKDFEDYDETPFYNIRSNITSFTFGNEVEHIPAYLCYGMSKLTEMTIPNSVTSIGSSAFSSCSGLTSVTIPNSVTSIGSSAFEGCSKLTSVIWNAKNCEDFKYDSDYREYTSPFYNIRSNITSFTFGNKVEHIPAYLCYEMKNLKEVTIGNSVTSIGSAAFSDCSGLTEVIWNAKNYKDFSSSKYSPFYDISSNITSFTFGNEVEHIPAYLCYGMSKLTEITIPNSVTTIGYYTFSDCSGLTSVTIPNSVTTIGSDAFYNCSGLTKVNYLGTVDKWMDIDFKSSYSNPTYYAKDLYINNELLTDVKITTADSIKDCVFYNCKSIKSLEIANNVTTIGSSAFSGCSGLTSVTIHNSVTSIGQYAFKDCSGLTKVNYLGTVDKWVDIDFEDSRSNPTYYAKDLYINNELLTDVKITTADSIKDCAFYNCQSIKSVEIGESVTSIGSSAFSGCDKLRKVTAYPTTVPNVYKNSFAHYNAALYVPCDVYDDYFYDEVWGTFKVTDCIAAEEVDAPDKVEIEVDEDNNANVIWPSTDGAKKYELEISKDGEVFCTLIFNENGQLTSIDFGNRSASVGFQFTVTGLDGASKYAYSMVAMDKKGNELQSYKGTFTTNGYVPGPGEEDEPTSITETLADANITVSGGKISADADFSIYNTIGQDVTAFNGSLQRGVYLVSIENNIVKVMVK